jgi:hypothetical protein
LQTTKNNTVLAFPQTEADREILLRVAGTVKFRPTRPTAPKQALHQGVLLNVPTDLDNETLSKELGLTCRRLIAAKNNQPTNKVKITFPNKIDLENAIKNGKTVGAMLHKCVEYRSSFSNLTQCYKCQGYSHMAGKCQAETKCSRCSGPHSKSVCDSTTIKCSNCGGNHTAGFPGCSVRKQSAVEAETEALTTAQLLTRGNRLEAVRLATVLSRSISKVLAYGGVTIDEQVITSLVAIECSSAFKVPISGATLFHSLKDLQTTSS